MPTKSKVLHGIWTIVGKDFAAKMEEMFARDLQVSTPIHLEKCKKRGIGERHREL